MKFNKVEFEKKLKLIVAFGERDPVDYLAAYQIALEHGITSQQIIIDSLEVHAANKGFGVQKCHIIM